MQCMLLDNLELNKTGFIKCYSVTRYWSHYKHYPVGFCDSASQILTTVAMNAPPIGWDHIFAYKMTSIRVPGKWGIFTTVVQSRTDVQTVQNKQEISAFTERKKSWSYIKAWKHLAASPSNYFVHLSAIYLSSQTVDKEGQENGDGGRAQ